jgi:hypothetical protein
MQTVSISHAVDCIISGLTAAPSTLASLSATRPETPDDRSGLHARHANQDVLGNVSVDATILHLGRRWSVNPECLQCRVRQQDLARTSAQPGERFHSLALQLPPAQQHVRVVPLAVTAAHRNHRQHPVPNLLQVKSWHPCRKQQVRNLRRKYVAIVVLDLVAESQNGLLQLRGKCTCLGGSEVGQTAAPLRDDLLHRFDQDRQRLAQPSALGFVDSSGAKRAPITVIDGTSGAVL